MKRRESAMQRAPWIRIGQWTVLVMLWATLPLLGGCGGSGDGVSRGAVKGKVTLDGEPLQEGRIMFEPTGGNQGPVAGGSIEGGAYEIGVEKGVVVGKNLVRINAIRKTGKKVKSIMSDEMVDETEEAVPEKYNTNSTLEKDVQAGENVLDFELTSK